MAKRGRRSPGKSTFTEYLAQYGLPKELDIIARAAAERGMTVTALGENMVPKRPRQTLAKLFTASSRKPQRATLNDLARGVGMSPLHFHTLIGDLTVVEREQLVAEVLDEARLEPRAYFELIEWLRQIFVTAPEQMQDAALRAFVEGHQCRERRDRMSSALSTEELFIQATEEAERAGKQRGMKIPGKIENMPPILRFAEALGIYTELASIIYDDSATLIELQLALLRSGLQGDQAHKLRMTINILDELHRSHPREKIAEIRNDLYAEYLSLYPSQKQLD